MKSNRTKKNMTFGEFIANIYNIYGQRKARGIVRLALKSHLIEFRGHPRVLLS